jgi:hypothetical protein
MKTFPKVGLLAVVALLATAAAATSAQAATFNPDNTAVSWLSTNSSFTYGVAFISCDRATADGNTGLDSDRISDLALTFTQNCAVPGWMPAQVDCVGDVSLIADPDADDTGTLELNEGFQCVYTMTICTISVAGPQTTQPKNTSLDEASQVLEANVVVQATRSGSNLCGPESGSARYTADYDITNNSDPPVPVTIDP